MSQKSQAFDIEAVWKTQLFWFFSLMQSLIAGAIGGAGCILYVYFTYDRMLWDELGLYTLWGAGVGFIATLYVNIPAAIIFAILTFINP